MQRQRGLTLLELLVVLAIIGVAMAGVSLSLRDSHQTQLEREAQRLIAVLEAARAQSRTSGIALIWQATPDGFVVRPTPGGRASPIASRTETWLTAGTQATADNANTVALGPEPILLPARITLRVIRADSQAPAPSLIVGTDGLRPFQVLP
jgi:general secretion pathway protein H